MQIALKALDTFGNSQGPVMIILLTVKIWAQLVIVFARK